MKYSIKLGIVFMALSVSFFAYGQIEVLSYKDFTKSFKIGKSYPIILEGYNLSGLIDRTGQFYCGAIAFTEDSNENQMFYTFKAWAPENGKCNFQSSDPVYLEVKHQCVNDHYKEERKFTKAEIDDTRPGNRAIEIKSDDDNFYVLSRCNGTMEQPSYLQLSSYGTDVRDPSNIRVTSMASESRSFEVLEDASSQVDVLTIQLNNGWNYVLIKDNEIN